MSPILIGILAAYTSLNTTAHIIQLSKIARIEKIIKIQKMEIAIVEAILAISIGATAFDEKLIKKTIATNKQLIDNQLALLTNDMSAFKAAILNLDVDSLNRKLDALAEETKKQNTQKVVVTIPPEEEK